MINLEQATHIEVDAEVRYWEDAIVDGVQDTDGKLIPGRQGEAWKIRISLAEGKIAEWPTVNAKIHYKVCDAGLYWLTDDHGRRIAKWKGSYVPDRFLCHGAQGNGDYIIMAVSRSGLINDYTPPTIKADEWGSCLPPKHTY